MKVFSSSNTKSLQQKRNYTLNLNTCVCVQARQNIQKKMVEMQHTPKLTELQHNQESLNAVNPNKKRTMTNQIK